MILYIIENMKTGKFLSLPNPDDQLLWDKVERFESIGMRNLIVRVLNPDEIKQFTEMIKNKRPN